MLAWSGLQAVTQPLKLVIYAGLSLIPGLGLGAGTVQHGPHIQVELLHAATGKPLSGQQVWIYSGPPTLVSSKKVTAVTNDAGIADVDLPWSGEAQIFVDLPTKLIACSSGWVSLQSAIESGVITPNKCNASGSGNSRSDSATAPTPGRIVEFAKPWTFWERLKRFPG